MERTSGDNSSDSPRSTERLFVIMDALTKASSHGLRLTDIIEATGLGKATAHRLINGLADWGLVDFEPDLGRYFVGMKVLAWAASARNRFSISRMAEPALARIAGKTGDTVYLIGRSGDHAVCLECWEGSFPIKVLTLAVGDRRPLGIGAGSLAILATLPDSEVERIFVQQARDRAEYAFGEKQLRDMIETTRRDGYAFNDIHVFKNMANVTGMAAVAVALKRPDGMPVAALHVTSITSRLSDARQDEIVNLLNTERRQLEESIQPVLEESISQKRGAGGSEIGSRQ